MQGADKEWIPLIRRVNPKRVPKCVPHPMFMHAEFVGGSPSPVHRTLSEVERSVPAELTGLGNLGLQNFRGILESTMEISIHSA